MPGHIAHLASVRFEAHCRRMNHPHRAPAISLKRAVVPALRKSAPGRFQPLPNRSIGQAVKRRIWLRDLVACGVALPLLALALWRDHGQTPWVKNGWAGLPGRVHRGIPNPRHLASVLNQPQGFGSWHARPRRIIRTRQSGQRLSSSTVGRHPFLARYKEKPT